jgi:hypothetical protein
MAKQTRGGSRQRELIPYSKRPTIPLDENHRLVVIADEIDWTELLELVERIRLTKVKNAAGRPPHLRALVGAVLLRATRRMAYREAEDFIRYYAPARYLCGLTETEWSPDHNTICDFETLLGEDGVRQVNEYAVKWAVAEKLADPSVVVGDTTAQEAAVPHPNEMGHLAAFMASVATACGRAGKALRRFVQEGGATFQAAKEKLRRHRLFAKTRAARLKLLGEMTGLVERTQRGLAAALQTTAASRERLRGYANLAQARAKALHETMKKLLPQVRYWMRTGKVAANKIINVHIPELYSIVRGKAGKAVEFGLKWGLVRLRGGFLLATVAMNRRELTDTKFAVDAVDDCIRLFGKPPHGYGYDRGGWSKENVAELKRKGVKHVGLAPQGQASWAVKGKKKDELVKERAQVEAGIGAVKSSRYGFHRPAARSARKMGTCGQMAVLGFNLNKLAREMVKRNGEALVG